MRTGEIKAEKRKKLFMSLFIVAVMTLSALGYMAERGSNQQLKYGAFKFSTTNTNKVLTKINNNEILFDYMPQQVENINVTPEIIQRLKSSIQIDTTSDPKSIFKEEIALAQFDLSNSLSKDNKYLRIGFTDKNDFNKPVMTCQNATEFIPVLMFEKSNETSISENGKCIMLNARSAQDFRAIKDRLLYGIFGVIA